jgi:D-alanine-D-alanine ligase
MIRRACSEARQVIVLRPGGRKNSLITQRRGQRKLLLRIHGEPRKPGQVVKRPDALRWVGSRLDAMAQIGSRKDRLSVSVMDIQTEAFPTLLPHEVALQILVTYLDPAAADRAEAALREILGRGGPRWELEGITDRPASREPRGGSALTKSLFAVAARWSIPLESQSSVWPSVAGLVPAGTDVVCGMGPVAQDLYTPQESVLRLSLVQRTLLIAQFLAGEAVSK